MMVGLFEILVNNGTILSNVLEETPRAELVRMLRAALTLAVLSVIVLFLTLQRYYVRSLTMTGIKG